MDALSLVNGTVFDGTGAGPYRATVHVEDDRIVAVQSGGERPSPGVRAMHVDGIGLIDDLGRERRPPGLREPVRADRCETQCQRPPNLAQ